MENKKRMVFFHQGDIVRLKDRIENAPKHMMVQKIAMVPFKTGDKKTLLGADVIWFDQFQASHTARFSTKDIEHVKLED